jgi:hypothetical protein
MNTSPPYLVVVKRQNPLDFEYCRHFYKFFHRDIMAAKEIQVAEIERVA